MRIANKALGPSDPRDLLANIPTPLNFQLGNTDTVLYCIMGKNIVFAMTIKLIPEFWRNQEIPEKFWKTYEQV